jgi:hypothetical protein
LKLADRIKHAITALQDADDLLLDEDSDTPRISGDFHVQIDRLTSKMQQILGDKAIKVSCQPPTIALATKLSRYLVILLWLTCQRMLS